MAAAGICRGVFVPAGIGGVGDAVIGSVDSL